MWPFSRAGVPTYEADNIVGEGTTIRGDLRGPGGFRVDGAVLGSIESDGPVVIGEKGAVEGEVKGRDVVVLGRVHGNVTATARLEIGPVGRVMGDVDVVSLEVHPGGTFHGASRIGDAGGEARLVTSTSPFGILPVSTVPADANANAKDKGGRTLPPPVGAVPPPAPSPAVTAPMAVVGSSPKIPSAPAASTIERIAPRESGEAVVPKKAAAND